MHVVDNELAYNLNPVSCLGEGLQNGHHCEG